MASRDKPQQNRGVKPSFSISVIVVIVNLLRQKWFFAICLPHTDRIIDVKTTKNSPQVKATGADTENDNLYQVLKP